MKRVLTFSKIARARGLAQALADGPDASPLAAREIAAEIVDLLDLDVSGLVDEAKRIARISVTREPDDPEALRASIGGREDVGYYLVFRGDPEEVLDMLRAVLPAAEAMLPVGNYKGQR